MDPGSLLMLVIIMIIFYFVLVRPQKKRAQEHSALLKALAPGDEVVTIGGVYGFVNRVEDDAVYLEVSEGTEIRLTKTAVAKRVDPGTADADEDELEALAEPADPDTGPPSGS